MDRIPNVIVTSQFGAPRPLSPDTSPQQSQSTSTVIPGAQITLEPDADDDATSVAPSEVLSSSFISCNTSLGVVVGHGSIIGVATGPADAEEQSASQYAQEYRANQQSQRQEQSPVAQMSTPKKVRLPPRPPTSPTPSSPVVDSQQTRRRTSSMKFLSSSLSRTPTNSPPPPPPGHNISPIPIQPCILPEALPEPEREPFQEQRWMPRDPEAWQKRERVLLSSLSVPDPPTSPPPLPPQSPPPFSGAAMEKQTNYQPMKGLQNMDLL